MHPGLEVRPAAHERAGGAAVVEVDVGERERARELVAKLGQERVDRRGRAGVDQHAVDEPRADDVLAPEMADVDQAHSTTRSWNERPGRPRHAPGWTSRTFARARTQASS